MKRHHRPFRAAAIAVVGVAMIAATGPLGTVPASAGPVVTAPLAALADSVPITTDPMTGAYRAPSMTIQVALQPSDAAGLAGALQAMCTKGSSTYHQWLAPGEFDARYAPSGTEHTDVATFLSDPD